MRESEIAGRGAAGRRDRGAPPWCASAEHQPAATAPAGPRPSPSRMRRRSAGRGCWSDRHEPATASNPGGPELKTASGSIRSTRSRAATRTCSTPSRSASRSTRLSLGPRRTTPVPATAPASRTAASSSWRSPAPRTRSVTGYPGSAANRRTSSVDRRRPLRHRAPSTSRSRVRTASARRIRRAGSIGSPGTIRSTRMPGVCPTRRWRRVRSGPWTRGVLMSVLVTMHARYRPRYIARFQEA